MCREEDCGIQPEFSTLAPEILGAQLVFWNVAFELAVALDRMLTKNVEDDPVMVGMVQRTHVSLNQIVAAHEVGLIVAATVGLAFENERPNKSTPELPVTKEPKAADTDHTTGSGYEYNTADDWPLLDTP